ncbi:MAG: hypothetical protein UY09_C0014G0001, partial [Parcubacteria group bacterium GW2011_GWA2_47_8]
MPYKITKHSADVGVPERAFVFFLAIAIVVVFIAVVSVFFPHDSRTTQDASPTTTLTPFEPSVYNIVAIVTGIGQGVAIPHAKSEDVSKIVASLGISKAGIDFDSLDGEPVYIIFLMVAPPESISEHLQAIAKISRLLKDKFFR